MIVSPRIVPGTQERLDELGGRATMVLSMPAAFRIEGPGAVQCLQGLVTCDVEAAGPDSVTYGALLTSKGMIVTDFTILRDPAGFTLLAAMPGRVPALEAFSKLLPPRLARLIDLTEQRGVLSLLGPDAEAVVRNADLPWPAAPGRLVGLPSDAGPSVLARPQAGAHWSAMVVGSQAAVQAVRDRLARAGAVAGTQDDLEAARILAGWPALGLEIDDRTLPQEVRFDELGGVSYTKGCYVGQETVARVHFRGHVNRAISGLAWVGAVPPQGPEVLLAGKVVGRVTSVLQLPSRGVGLAMLRREVAPDEMVDAAGVPARVTALPFEEALASGRPRLVTGD